MPLVPRIGDDVLSPQGVGNIVLRLKSGSGEVSYVALIIHHLRNTELKHKSSTRASTNYSRQTTKMPTHAAIFLNPWRKKKDKQTELRAQEIKS